jgi:hypothetical protein
MHHLDFFSFSSWTSLSTAEGGGGMGTTGEGPTGEVISPLAVSNDVRPSGFGVNHPPGKNLEEVVDSCLMRSVLGETFRNVEVPSERASSLTGARRDTMGLWSG